MNVYTILTNNRGITGPTGPASPASPTGPDGPFEVAFVPGGLEEFYDELGDRLQNGYRLVSSPLPVNVPLTRSPVRSVILQKSGRRFDARGLMTLERAKNRASILGVNKDPRVLGDLEMIDRDQLGCAIRQLEAAFA